VKEKEPEKLKEYQDLLSKNTNKSHHH